MPLQLVGTQTVFYILFRVHGTVRTYRYCSNRNEQCIYMEYFSCQFQTGPEGCFCNVTEEKSGQVY